MLCRLEPGEAAKGDQVGSNCPAPGEQLRRGQRGGITPSFGFVLFSPSSVASICSISRGAASIAKRANSASLMSDMGRATWTRNSFGTSCAAVRKYTSGLFLRTVAMTSAPYSMKSA